MQNDQDYESMFLQFKVPMQGWQNGISDLIFMRNVSSTGNR
jgi:hypothetical protein